ncbi:MAG TPA: polysaccharide biosynthesis protein [Chloroflexota bacterium]|nr:polysaccharide biosynthesis protein [Chloroflexota bacterium]
MSLALERLDPTALLGRPQVAVDCAGASTALGGRRILVTGAGGSVGVPLVERLLGLQPAQLVLLDSHEDSLFRLQRRLMGLNGWSGAAAAPGAEGSPPSPPLSSPAPQLVLADVRNRDKMTKLFREWEPEVVFHLAAYKHVHFGEAQPDEPISVNVLATHALVETAVAHSVQAFVYTSSDKAVNPPSIYGATKRLAELVVRWGARQGRGRFVVVRFVNVLGTRGSVIETFLEQVAAGQPLTITDPAMTRYWMSQREAVDLALAAAASGRSGTTLLVDPGPPVRVLDMAERVRALAGSPGSALATRVLGRRPGERLAEELASARERLVPGPACGLLAVEHVLGDAPLGRVPEYVAALQAALTRDDPALGDQLMALARELQ